MPSAAFASGLIDGYINSTKEERDRKEKNAAAAVNFLISTGRVRDYNDILPLMDVATGGPGQKTSGKGAGGKGGKTDPHSVLSQFVNLGLKAQQSSGSGQPQGGPPGGQPPPFPTPASGTGGSSGAPGTAGSAGSPASGTGPLLSDTELSDRRTADTIRQNQALNAADIQAIRDRATQLRQADPTMDTQEALAAAAESLGKKWPTQRRVGQPKSIGTPVDPVSDPTARTADGRLFSDAYPDVKGMQRMTAIGPNGDIQSYWEPAQPPKATPVKLPARLQEAVDEELASHNIDPRTATPAQQNSALAAAGKRLREKGNLDTEAERALVAARLLTGAANANASHMGVMGPKGEDLPQVSIGADGRPDPQAQEELLSHFDHGTQAAIKGMADYTINPSTASNRTSGAGKPGSLPTRLQMVEWVKQYDPTYDDKLYGIRNRVQTDWSSGKTRDAMVATNTVVRHLDELAKATTALEPWSWSTLPSMNKSKMTAQAEFSKPLRDAIKNFTVASQAVSSELERVYRGTGGSQTDITEWRNNLSPYDATDAKQAALKTAVNLMFGRINASVDGYKSSMGKLPPPGMALSEGSARILGGLGIDMAGLSYAPGSETAAPEAKTTAPKADADRTRAVDYLRRNKLPIDEQNIQHYLKSVKPAA